MKNYKTSLDKLGLAFAILGFLFAAGCTGAELTADDTTNSPPASDSMADTTVATAVAEVDVPTPEPTGEKVVTIGSAVKPGSTAAGSVVTIAVRVRTMKPWHIYAINKPTGVSVPTKLKLKLPAGVTEVGEWDIPEPKKYDEETFIYEEDVVFRKQLKIAADATGLVNIACDVKYQPCNDQSCKQPTSETTSVALEISAP